MDLVCEFDSFSLDQRNVPHGARTGISQFAVPCGRLSIRWVIVRFDGSALGCHHRSLIPSPWNYHLIHCSSYEYLHM